MNKAVMNFICCVKITICFYVFNHFRTPTGVELDVYISVLYVNIYFYTAVSLMDHGNIVFSFT